MGSVPEAGSMKSMAVGRAGGLAIVYFLAASTLALILGLIVVNVVSPGAGANIDLRTLVPRRSRSMPSRGR
jgi:aerobic C4-dicarboxylate transport protein